MMDVIRYSKDGQEYLDVNSDVGSTTYRIVVSIDGGMPAAQLELVSQRTLADIEAEAA